MHFWSPMSGNFYPCVPQRFGGSRKQYPAYPNTSGRGDRDVGSKPRTTITFLLLPCKRKRFPSDWGEAQTTKLCTPVQSTDDVL